MPSPSTSATSMVWKHAMFAVRRLQVGSAGDDATAKVLEAERINVLDMRQRGWIDPAETDRRLAGVAERASRLSVRRWVGRIAIPPDIAADPPEKVNTYLRRLWDHVDLDPATFQPVHFEWRDPSMRAEVVED